MSGGLRSVIVKRHRSAPVSTCLQVFGTEVPGPESSLAAHRGTVAAWGRETPGTRRTGPGLVARSRSWRSDRAGDGAPRDRCVAIGVVRSESAQARKQSPASCAVSAQLREVGVTFEMLVAEPERGSRDGGAPPNEPLGAAGLRLKRWRCRRYCSAPGAATRSTGAGVIAMLAKQQPANRAPRQPVLVPSRRASTRLRDARSSKE
jgi:hypothetical protein